MNAPAPTPSSPQTSTASTGRSMLATSAAPVALVALLVVVVAPVLRTLYPILYEIGEDWSYPGVGAVGLVLYAAPLLAVVVAGARPATGLIVGVAACAAALALVEAADPISRWVGGAATVIALFGMTAVLLKLAAAGAARVALFVGFLVGMALDTALRGALRTWDLPWRPGALPLLVALIPAVLALLLAWRIARDFEDAPTRGSTAATSAVLGLGGLVALQVLFLQSSGFASSQASIPFWAGVLVILAADAAALLAVALAPALLGSPLGLSGAVVAALAGTVALPIMTGAAVIPVIVLAQVALCALMAAALVFEPPAPDRLRRWAGPARSAGAAVVALLLIFGWQFYIDTPLPFPRWVIPALGALLIAVAAGVAARRSTVAEPRANGRESLRRLVAAPAALAVVLAVVVPAGLWLARPAIEETAGAAGTLRVLTYNVRSGVDPDGQMRPDAIADVIGSYDPDVVVLQEVGRGWPVHAGTDVQSYLEAELGLASVYRGAADEQFGNVILSRLPMTTVSTGYLPDVGGQRRSYVAVNVDVGGQPVLVVGAHLEDRSVEQIQALRAIVGDTTPAVIAGDLNLHPDEPEVSELDGLVDVVEATGDRCRPSSAEPIRPCDRPDWILLAPGLTVQDLQIGTVAASDHLPLVATLALAP